MKGKLVRGRDIFDRCESSGDSVTGRADSRRREELAPGVARTVSSETNPVQPVTGTDSVRMESLSVSWLWNDPGDVSVPELWGVAR